MAESLSEQVARLERERDVHRNRADHNFRGFKRLEAELNAAESRLADAERRAVREAADVLIEFVRTWRGFDADVAGPVGPSTGNVLLRHLREFRDREYPATGEEPTRGDACFEFCGDKGCKMGCELRRPAPPAVTEPEYEWSDDGYRKQVYAEKQSGRVVGSVDGECAYRSDLGLLGRYVTVAKARAAVEASLASRPTASGEG